MHIYGDIQQWRNKNFVDLSSSHIGVIDDTVTEKSVTCCLVILSDKSLGEESH